MKEEGSDYFPLPMWSWTSHLLQVSEPVFSSINGMSIFSTSRIVLRNKNREVFTNGGETQTSGTHIVLMLFAIRCRAVAVVRLKFLKEQIRIGWHPPSLPHPPGQGQRAFHPKGWALGPGRSLKSALQDAPLPSSPLTKPQTEPPPFPELLFSPQPPPTSLSRSSLSNSFSQPRNCSSTLCSESPSFLQTPLQVNEPPRWAIITSLNSHFLHGLSLPTPTNSWAHKLSFLLSPFQVEP